MIKINKIIPAALLLTSISSVALADNWNVGASASYGNIDGTASDTQLDSRTSTTVAQDRGAKSGDADFPFASIFLEYAKTMDKNLDIITNDEYKYGFVTSIETDDAPRGLNEDIIRFIFGKRKRRSK